MLRLLLFAVSPRPLLRSKPRCPLGATELGCCSAPPPSASHCPAYPMLGGSAHAGIALEERKLPMKFSWVACQPNCRGWVSAVGIRDRRQSKGF